MENTNKRVHTGGMGHWYDRKWPALTQRYIMLFATKPIRHFFSWTHHCLNFDSDIIIHCPSEIDELDFWEDLLSTRTLCQRPTFGKAGQREVGEIFSSNCKSRY